METIQIVMCIDERYAQHAGVTIASILYNKKSNHPITFHIINDGLSVEAYHNLQQITERHGAALVSHTVDAAGFANLPLGEHISKATYFRLAIPDILPPSIEKVLYMDVDLLVRADISELWQVDISAYHAAAVKDLVIENNKNGKGVYLRAILNIPANETYFNAGVLLMNLTKWRADSTSRKVLSFINDNAGKILYADQDGLNAILTGKWVCVHPKWNVYRSIFTRYYDRKKKKKLSHDFLQAGKHPSIVHFTGPLKPWHDACLTPYAQEYYFYLAMTPWKGYKAPGATMRQLLKKYHRTLRRFLLDHVIYPLTDR